MKAFTGAVVSVYLAVGVPVHVHAETNLEVTQLEAVSPAFPDLSDTSSSAATVSTASIQVDETIRFFVADASPEGKNLYGRLHGPTIGEREQQRVLSFSYNEDKQCWEATYTATAYDRNGAWTLELIGVGDHVYHIENAASFMLNNETPLEDKRLPELQSYTVLYNHKPLTSPAAVQQEGTLSLQVRADDIGSDVHTVAAQLVKKNADKKLQQLEKSDLLYSVSMKYDMQANEWSENLELEKVEPGEYLVTVELEDYAGNKEMQEISTLVVEDEEAVETTTIETAEGEIPQEAEVPTEEDKSAELPIEIEENPATEQLDKEEEKVETSVPAEPAEQPVVELVPELPVAETKQTVEETTAAAPKPVTEKQESNATEQQQSAAVKTEEKTTVAPQQQGKQSSALYYAAGVLLLMSVLRSNKEWSE